MTEHTVSGHVEGRSAQEIHERVTKILDAYFGSGEYTIRTLDVRHVEVTTFQGPVADSFTADFQAVAS